jgi:hypothetical protein
MGLRQVVEFPSFILYFVLMRKGRNGEILIRLVNPRIWPGIGVIVNVAMDVGVIIISYKTHNKARRTG